MEESAETLCAISRIVAAFGYPDVESFRPQRPAEDGHRLDVLVGVLSMVDEPDVTKLLCGIAAFAPEEMTRSRVRRVVEERHRSEIPEWLSRLDDASFSKPAVALDPLGDGEELVLGANLVGGGSLSAVCYVDHNLGSAMKDAFVPPMSVEEVVSQMTASAQAEGQDIEWERINPAEARARTEQAIELGARFYPPLETNSWPATRPIVEWMSRLLPAGRHSRVPGAVD